MVVATRAAAKLQPPHAYHTDTFGEPLSHAGRGRPMRILVPLVIIVLATPVAAAPFDAGKCIIGSAALVPRSPATSIKAANVRSMTPAEAKNWPQGGTWVDIQVEALGASATYTFMCGQGSDGATKVWLMR